MMSIEAMKQALEKATEVMEAACIRVDELKAENESLRQAIAEAEKQDHIRDATKMVEQEPVAWTEQRFYDDGTPNPCSALKWAGRNAEDDFPVGTKFYTTPPQRKPLNEVKLKALWKRIIHSEDYACPTFHAFSLGFRTAEAAHGIGENK